VIAFVRGTVQAVGVDRLVLDCGAVGVVLLCAPATAAGFRTGQAATVPAALVVREDALTLYGFRDDDERAVFDVLQSVSGIGPRLALAVLGTLGADGLRAAVAAEDVTALTRVSGIGRKGAQRLVLELRDSLGATPTMLGAAPPPVVTAGGWAEQVRAALVGLGWSSPQAEDAVRAVTPLATTALAEGAAPDVGALLKAALRTLDRPA
jgi:Holliday junction DNA helicase RuvA